MIVLDTSAVVCVAKREENYGAYLAALISAECLIGAPTALECRMVLSGDKIARSSTFLDELLARPNVTVAPFGAHHLALAGVAFARFGKGRGSGVGLNFGDCMSYAVAKHENAPLLFTGNDFRRTDLRPALP